MSVDCFFRSFEHDIRRVFDSGRRDAGEAAESIRLIIADKAWNTSPSLAEFCAVPAEKLVHVTWSGIASLWAFCHGAARLSGRMYEARKAGESRLAMEPGSPLEAGLFLLELSRRFCHMDLARDAQGHCRWVEWAPRPTISPETFDEKAGNFFFFSTISWILRHEVAHITLNHVEREKSEGRPWPDYEVEADDQATDWLKSGLNADIERPLGAAPSSEELELERRGVAVGLSSIWIAMFEAVSGYPSILHPPVAERLHRNFDRLKLREDSAAAAIISDTIQVWLSPEEAWSSPEKPFKDQIEFLGEAAITLHRKMTSLKH